MLNRMSILCVLIALALGQSASVPAAESSSAGQRPAVDGGDRQPHDFEDGGAGELQVAEAARELRPEAQTEFEAGRKHCLLAWNTTTSDYGQGTNCLRARFNLLDLLRQQTACRCGICSEELVIEVPCTGQQGAYVVSGYLKYKCWLEF